MAQRSNLPETREEKEQIERLRNFYNKPDEDRERIKANYFAIILIVLFIIILGVLLFK